MKIGSQVPRIVFSASAFRDGARSGSFVEMDATSIAVTNHRAGYRGSRVFGAQKVTHAFSNGVPDDLSQGTRKVRQSFKKEPTMLDKTGVIKEAIRFERLLPNDHFQVGMQNLLEHRG